MVHAIGTVSHKHSNFYYFLENGIIWFFESTFNIKKMQPIALQVFLTF